MAMMFVATSLFLILRRINSVYYICLKKQNNNEKNIQKPDISMFQFA